MSLFQSWFRNKCHVIEIRNTIGFSQIPSLSPARTSCCYSSSLAPGLELIFPQLLFFLRSPCVPYTDFASTVAVQPSSIQCPPQTMSPVTAPGATTDTFSWWHSEVDTHRPTDHLEWSQKSGIPDSRAGRVRRGTPEPSQSSTAKYTVSATFTAKLSRPF